MMKAFWQDIQHGWRMLVRRPGFTFIAALSLALGIGANTVIFSLINTTLLRPLPFEAPGELVIDRKSTRLNSSHSRASRMPSSA